MRSHVGRNTRFLHAFGMLTLCQSFKNAGGNLPDWWGFAVYFNPPICTGLPVLCTRFTHGVSFWQKGAGGKFPAGGLRLIKRNRPEPQRCMGWFFLSGGRHDLLRQCDAKEEYVRMKMRRRNLRSSKMFGVISRKGRVPNRKIDQEVGRSWECDCCYITLDKDTNAASNIKRIREAQLGSPA